MGNRRAQEPLTEGEVARYVVVAVAAAAAAAAVWAPSVHNTQPWRLSEQEREICVHAVARSRLHRLTYKCQGGADLYLSAVWATYMRIAHVT